MLAIELLKIVFYKKENVVFEKVGKLSCTICGSGGFDLTGI